jgi:DNA repair exonuclease SbcCD ATPase subunit
MAASTLSLTAAERADLLRDPAAFANRIDSVLTGMVQKLHRVEAERAAERTDSERLYHQLERNSATLREESTRAIAQYEKMAAERQTIIDARDAATAEVARLGGELRAAGTEIARAKETEREAAEERQRLLQLNERKRVQLESTERDLASAHTALAEAKRHAADLELRVAEREAEAHTAKMQVGCSTVAAPLSPSAREASPELNAPPVLCLPSSPLPSSPLLSPPLPASPRLSPPLSSRPQLFCGSLRALHLAGQHPARSDRAC